MCARWVKQQQARYSHKTSHKDAPDDGPWACLAASHPSCVEVTWERSAHTFNKIQPKTRVTASVRAWPCTCRSIYSLANVVRHSSNSHSDVSLLEPFLRTRRSCVNVPECGRSIVIIAIRLEIWIPFTKWCSYIYLVIQGEMKHISFTQQNHQLIWQTTI